MGVMSEVMAIADQGVVARAAGEVLGRLAWCVSRLRHLLMA